MANMLIIDEDKRSVDILKQYLEKNNHNVTYAYSFEEGEACIKNAEFSIVFLDTNLPDCNGILLLREIIKLTRKPEIIIVTRNLNEIDTQEALANGVWDIFVKPFSLNHLSQTIESALDFWKQSNKVNIFRGIAKRTMLGSSAAMISCQEMAGIAAKNDVPVLIVGETGTGKELLANIIHQNSDRKKGRLVTIDCAALPQSLAESILFGT